MLLISTWSRATRAAVGRSPRGAAASVLLVLALLGTWAGAVALVRRRVGREAAMRHMAVSVGSVHLGWFAVRLGLVDVRLDGVDGVRLEFDEVRVNLSMGGRARSVDGSGGYAVVPSDLAKVAGDLEAWRSRLQQGHGSSGGEQLEVHAKGLDVRGAAPADGEANRPTLSARNVTIDRDASGTRLAVEDFAGEAAGFKVMVRHGKAELIDSRLKSTSATSAVVSWSVKAERGPAVAAMSDEVAPPPLPFPLSVKGKKKGKAPPVVVVESSPPPRLPLPHVRELRVLLGALAKNAVSRMSEGAELSVQSLTLELHAGDSRFAVGPGPASISLRDGEVSGRFATPPDPHGVSLAITATIPLAEGNPTLAVRGGPVPLSLFGAADGALGLTEVEHASLAGDGRAVLDARADTLSFDGEISLQNLALKATRLADDVVRGIDVSVAARGVVEGAHLVRLDDAEVRLGSARFRVRGTFDQGPDHAATALSFEAPATSCQALLTSIPPALVPLLRGARVEGTFGARGRLEVDTRALDDLVMDFTTDDRCAMTEVPEALAKERFAKPFLYTTYDASGNMVEEETGPRTQGWTTLDRISPFMQVAVLTTEDGGFLHHRGFSRISMRNALVANLKARRFVRGASTITMQLAKNLFLKREKTVSRKLEELILSDYLEQIFTKEEMMELYLNIIEFGPNVYGVTAAAQHYFGRSPAELDLAECLFLSSLLPSPLRYSKLFDQGTLPERWLNHVHELMVIAEKTGKISKNELADGLEETVVFRDPKGPNPAPRAAVRSSFLTGDDDPTEWRELN